MSEFKRDFIYTIPESVLFDPELTLIEFRLYMIIRSFMDTTGTAYPSNAWFARQLGIYPRSVPRCLKKLEDRKHICRISVDGKRYLVTGKPIPAAKVEAPELTSVEGGVTDDMGGCHPGHGGDVTPDIQLDHNNIISKIIDHEDDNYKKQNASAAKRATIPQRIAKLDYHEQALVDKLKTFKGMFAGQAVRIVEQYTQGEINNVIEMALGDKIKMPGAYISASLRDKNIQELKQQS